MWLRLRFHNRLRVILFNETYLTMIKHLLLFGILFAIPFATAFSQTDEELLQQKTEKEGQAADLQAQLNTLKSEISGLEAKLVKFPRWEKGAFGVIGFNFSGFNNWFSRADQANTVSNSYSFSGNAFANYFTNKSFWRNSFNLNVGRIKLLDKNAQGDAREKVVNSPDAINLISLYGYKLSEKFAISTLTEYRSTIVENFNNPGYLDFGVGATWTPIPDLVFVIHPFNYNIVFAEEGSSFESSLGAKIVGNYTKQVAPGVNWKSNLSLFTSYKDSDLSNWTWVNGIAFKAWKKIGVGMELGLRSNKQEALAAEKTDNPMQTYWVVGLSYGF